MENQSFVYDHCPTTTTTASIVPGEKENWSIEISTSQPSSVGQFLPLPSDPGPAHSIDEQRLDPPLGPDAVSATTLDAGSSQSAKSVDGIVRKSALALAKCLPALQTAGSALDQPARACDGQPPAAGGGEVVGKVSASTGLLPATRAQQQVGQSKRSSSVTRHVTQAVNGRIGCKLQVSTTRCGSSCDEN